MGRSTYRPTGFFARQGWGPGDGRDYNEVFRDLNEASAQMMREWNKPAIGQKKLAASQPQTQTAVPGAAPSVATSLPRIPQESWTSFKSGKGAWIRREVAAEVAALLAKSDKKSAVIGSYLYKLSGDSDQFVNRFTHNGEST